MSYIKKKKDRKRRKKRKIDDEAQHLGQILPLCFSLSLLGSFTPFGKNAVATQGPRIHQKWVMLTVIIIKHTYTHTHKRDGGNWIFMEKSSATASALSFYFLLRHCHKYWSRWILNTQMVSLLIITQSKQMQIDMHLCTQRCIRSKKTTTTTK